MSAAFKGTATNGTARMVARFGDQSMQVLFGKAFLLELERGNLDSARIFARALLAYASRPRVTGGAVPT